MFNDPPLPPLCVTGDGASDQHHPHHVLLLLQSNATLTGFQVGATGGCRLPPIMSSYTMTTNFCGELNFRGFVQRLLRLFKTGMNITLKSFSK